LRGDVPPHQKFHAVAEFAAIYRKGERSMLPFDQKPWAKQVAALVIVVTLLGAAGTAFYLHATKGLDTGAIVAIFLIVLALVPPNVVILRRRRTEEERRQASMVPARSSIR
jgi:hypothetical protein